MVKLCPEQFERLCDDAIIERWCSLFKGPLLVQRYRSGGSLTPAERRTVEEIAAIWRTKLSDLSWFMRCLNQPIAAQANREDGCSGKFWESRFTSQALTTEEALTSCMAYVELNPVRACMADTPETSDYTSFQERLRPDFDLEKAVKQQIEQEELRYFNAALKPLLPFDNATTDTPQAGIPCAFESYIALVDWTGRAIREDKRGSIDHNLSPILERLGLSAEQWLINTTRFEAIHRRRFNRRPLKAVSD